MAKIISHVAGGSKNGDHWIIYRYDDNTAKIVRGSEVTWRTPSTGETWWVDMPPLPA
jgi:hypothetical protein